MISKKLVSRVTLHVEVRGTAQKQQPSIFLTKKKTHRKAAVLVLINQLPILHLHKPNRLEFTCLCCRKQLKRQVEGFILPFPN